MDLRLSLGLAPVSNPWSLDACSDASEEVLLDVVTLLDDSALGLCASSEALHVVNPLLDPSDDSLRELALLPDPLLEL